MMLAQKQDASRPWRAFRLWREGAGGCGCSDEGEGDGGYAYLDRVAGRRTVPVEIGARYSDQGGHSRLHSLGALLERLRGDKEAGERRAGPGEGEGEGNGEGWYLAQHSLLDQIPELAADVSPPPPVCGHSGERARRGQVQKVNVWLGPRGTVSPLHQDSMDNVLCQVRWRKGQGNAGARACVRTRAGE